LTLAAWGSIDTRLFASTAGRTCPTRFGLAFLEQFLKLLFGIWRRRTRQLGWISKGQAIARINIAASGRYDSHRTDLVWANASQQAVGAGSVAGGGPQGGDDIFVADGHGGAIWHLHGRYPSHFIGDGSQHLGAVSPILKLYLPYLVAPTADPQQIILVGNRLLGRGGCDQEEIA
jgi:hypothetical protein